MLAELFQFGQHLDSDVPAAIAEYTKAQQLSDDLFVQVLLAAAKAQLGRRSSPGCYHEIIADMSGALHDTVSRPEIAANVDSTGQNKSRHAVKRDGLL